MPLLGLFLLTPSGLAGTCNLPLGYDKYFLQALDDLESTTITKITDGLEDIGLGPLGNSLLVSSILDLKYDVFEKLFGNEIERAQWFNVTSEVLDIGSTLESNKINVAGGAANLAISCVFNETAERFSFDLNVASPDIDWNMSGFSSADVTFLPDSLPALDMSTPNLTLAYDLHIPLTVSLKLKKFFIGEVTANLSAQFEAGLSKSLPILPNNNVTFEGQFNLNASFSYSSISEWSLEGDFDASLEAKTALDEVQVATLGVRAFDNDLFDTKPRK